MVWTHNVHKVMPLQLSNHPDASPEPSPDASPKKPRFFRRKSNSSDGHDKSPVSRESFRCMDSKIIEDALKASCDSYEKISPRAATQLPQVRPSRLELHETGPLMSALNQRAHALQQQEQDAFRQQATINQHRPAARRSGNAAVESVPPVPPLPQQYRRIQLEKF